MQVESIIVIVATADIINLAHTDIIMIPGTMAIDMTLMIAVLPLLATATAKRTDMDEVKRCHLLMAVTLST